MHEDIRWYYVNNTHFLILPQNHKNATLKRRPPKTQPLNVAHPSPDKPGFSRKVWLARATPPVGGEARQAILDSLGERDPPRYGSVTGG